MTNLLKLLDKHCSFTTFFIVVVVLPIFVITALAAIPIINFQ